MKQTLADNRGKVLSRKKVEERVLDNIINSMGIKELAEKYMDTLSDDDLLQWATDEEGNFRDHD